jgi:hypothetical protein
VPSDGIVIAKEIASHGLIDDSDGRAALIPCREVAAGDERPLVGVEVILGVAGACSGGKLVASGDRRNVRCTSRRFKLEIPVGRCSPYLGG